MVYRCFCSSLCFNGHFSTWNWISRYQNVSVLDFVGAKGVVVTTGAIRHAKLQSKWSPPTNQHPTFYRPDALPVAQPTVSEHWRECRSSCIMAETKLKLVHWNVGLPWSSIFLLCTEVKVNMHTLDTAPLRSESPLQKGSGLARVIKGFHSFTCAPTRSSAIGMSHTCLCLPSRSWYSFTDHGGMEGWVDLGAN